MKTLPLALILIFITVLSANADPERDREFMSDFYKSRFPDVDINAHNNGAYALDANLREQWLSIEDFPPYEIATDEGRALFSVPFSNGRNYGDCFENRGLGVKQNYPYFDTSSEQVVTLEVAINQCRALNKEEPLDYSGSEIEAIMAYMAYTSRGKTFSIKIPDNPAALQAFEQGKAFYYERRGQLNFSCKSCHMQAVGKLLRSELLSASIGHATHWPTYRFKWGMVGGIQKRFAECNVQVRAEPEKLQSEIYRNLEYFLSYMANGLELNGPATRR